MSGCMTSTCVCTLLCASRSVLQVREHGASRVWRAKSAEPQGGGCGPVWCWAPRARLQPAEPCSALQGQRGRAAPRAAVAADAPARPARLAQPALVGRQPALARRRGAAPGRLVAAALRVWAAAVRRAARGAARPRSNSVLSGGLQAVSSRAPHRSLRLASCMRSRTVKMRASLVLSGPCVSNIARGLHLQYMLPSLWCTPTCCTA